MYQLRIYFGILMLVASLVMSGLAMTTCAQVFRLRNKRLIWKGGTLKGFPLFSTIFWVISLTFSVVMLRTGGGWHLFESGLYLLFSTAWFINSYFSSKRYITDYGLVKNINDPSQTVAWHQIHDFFERTDNDATRYVFIYQEKDTQKLSNILRLTLEVPKKNHADFKRLLAHKLGRRISCCNTESIDVRNLK